MSKMLRLELVGLVLLACTQILTEHRDFYNFQNQYGHQSRHYDSYEDQKMTREVRVTQGRLRGFVVQSRRHQNLQPVDVFLGVPYAAPPLASLRFTPPQSPRPWSGVRHSNSFAPVCPQVLPDLHMEVTPGRYEYLKRLLPYLRNQSEDCLYLNIYAPHQSEGQRGLRRFPVMVFIHGESFEWNSGNPYDGSMLASYGDVVFVTINFRLGILGFLRPGTSDNTSSNFGLLDQVAALLWLKENIAVFGGDPNSVTLVGHGTGAIFTNLLLISPVASRGAGLFKRGILMSGSALSANAIGKAPLQVTKQVAHALNCPTGTDKDLANCLQNRPLDSLLDVRIDKPPHVPAYAPLTDGAVVPKNPWDLMKSTEIFGRYDLMYGVTESEKFHELPPVALLHGLLDHERDKFLRDHVKATHELEPEMVLSKLLEHYGGYSSTFTNEFALKNREIVLQALSDSGTVAPLLLTGKMHARVNPKSYMYVFSHPRAMQDYYGQQQHQHTVHGEELAYILGIPVGGGKYHLQDRYNIGEALFSEAMMTWWCNFAHTGNPNAPRRSTFLTDGPKEWLQYELDWPEYDPENQTYFNLTIPPEVGSRYRKAEMKFWNEDLPELIRRPNVEPPSVQATHKPLRNRPAILDIADGITEYPGQTRPGMEYGMVETHQEGEMMIGSTGTMTKDGSKLHHGVILPDGVASDSTVEVEDVSATPESSTIKNSSALSLVIGFGVVFLLINLIAFFYLYHKRHNLKTKEKSLKRRLSQKDEGSKRSKLDKQTAEKNLELGNKHDSRPDLNEVLKNDKAYDNNSNFGRRSKLSRQNSTSTIDTHIKVREWIQQEIVHRCSPRFLRKTRETLQKEHQDKLSKQQEEERRKLQLEKLMSRKEEPIYEENPTIIVRPGKKLKTSRVPKVSVAIDATPATRTESVLNQIPIELAQGEKESFANRSEGVQSETPDSSSILTTPQVVIIEHHHSKSEPIPMVSAIYKHPKISESESGSVNSLYAKANPKLKSRLPRIGSPQSSEELTTTTSSSKNTGSDNLYDQVSPEEIYGQTTAPKFTTFGSKVKGDDINVTCREPTEERDSISPEEALKTIKRRKYPKVLPDIEKRRSLPVPNSLFIPKQHGNSLKDHKNNSQPNSPVGQLLPPLPPPRVFGTSKSLDLAEEDSSQQEAEPITTNLHVGPLLKRQDSTARNNSDPNLLETLNRKESHGTDNAKMNQSQSSGNISANILGTVKGDSSQLSAPSLNEAASLATVSGKGPVRIMGNPNWYRSKDSLSTSRPHQILAGSNVPAPDVSIGNPNWYKPLVTAACSRSDGDISPTVITIPPVSGTQTAITTRETNTGKPSTFLGDGNLKQNSSNSVNSSETLTNPSQQQQNWEPKGPAEPKIIITPRVGNLLGQSGQSLSHNLSNIAGGSGRKLIDEGQKVSVSPMANSQSLAAQDFNPSGVFPVSEQRTIVVGPKEEVREPKIIITPNNSGNVAANLKQPKIIIKPSTNPQKLVRENKNIPKVSAIPSPECQNLRNTEQQQTSHHDKKNFDPIKDQPVAVVLPTMEKPLLKEKPNVTRIPSFSKRNKNDQAFKLEKSWSPVYPEKAEIVQKVEAVPINKVTEVPLTPTMDRRTGIPMFAKKTSEKSSSTDSSNSTTNSNTGTIKKQPK